MSCFSLSGDTKYIFFFLNSREGCNCTKKTFCQGQWLQKIKCQNVIFTSLLEMETFVLLELERKWDCVHILPRSSPGGSRRHCLPTLSHTLLAFAVRLLSAATLWDPLARTNIYFSPENGEKIFLRSRWLTEDQTCNETSDGCSNLDCRPLSVPFLFHTSGKVILTVTLADRELCRNAQKIFQNLHFCLAGYLQGDSHFKYKQC